MISNTTVYRPDEEVDQETDAVEELRAHLSRLGVEVTDEIPHKEVADWVLGMDSSLFDFKK